MERDQLKFYLKHTHTSMKSQLVSSTSPWLFISSYLQLLSQFLTGFPQCTEIPDKANKPIPPNADFGYRVLSQR